jgi:hypothetical protein
MNPEKTSDRVIDIVLMSVGISDFERIIEANQANRFYKLIFLSGLNKI